MRSNERLDALELQMKAIEKKVWLIIVLGAVIFIKGSDGALLSVLTGASIAPEGDIKMEPAIFLALAAAAGSALRAYMGYVEKAKKKGLEFSWNMFLISVVPTIIAGFAAGIGFDLEPNLQNLLLVFLGAAGLNSLQDKLGLQKKV